MTRNPEEPSINIAFSSLSAALPEPRAVLNSTWGTEQLGMRIVSLHQTLGSTFGPDNVSVSILPGRMVHLPTLKPILEAADVPIHSVDAPSIKHYPIAMAQAAGNVVIGKIEQAKSHIGWAAGNVGSWEQQRKRTREGLELATTQDVKMVKASAEFFVDGRQGQVLIDDLKRRGEDVVVAVEIDGSRQTQSDYFTFMDRLRNAHTNGHIRIGYDLDTGHLERSTSYHDNSGNKPANIVLKEVFADPKRSMAVEIISLNQYVTDTPESHARLNDNERAVDLVESTQLVGRGVRDGNLNPSVTLLFETHPNDYDWFADTSRAGGVVYAQELKRAFYNTE